MFAGCFEMAKSSLSAKLAFIYLISCVTTIVVSFVIFGYSIYSHEMKTIGKQLELENTYLSRQITKSDSNVGSIRDGMLYLNDVPLGDGNPQNANIAPFKEIMDRVNSFSYAAIKETTYLKKVEKDGTSLRERFRLVSASNPKPFDELIIGKYLDDDTIDAIKEHGSSVDIMKINDILFYSYHQAIYDQNQEIVGILSTGRALNEVRMLTLKLAWFIPILLLIAIALSGIFLYEFSTKFTARLGDISSYLKRISLGEFPEDKLKPNSKDEINDVIRNVNNMVDALRKSERFRTELELASTIQAHMLPCIFPPFPEVESFDIFASMHPAKEVGGDFYDFFRLDEKRIAVVMADVSGKGIPAAFVMVITKTLIKNHAFFGMEPGDLFSTVNTMMAEENDNNMFVTAWMGVLNTETGILTYVNAGHNPPLLKHASNLFEYLHSPAGFVLAGMKGIRYRQHEIQLEPGDRLFLYTDGITEACDTQNQLFGEKRLRDFLNQHSTESAKALLNSLKDNIDSFSDKAEQFDDMTMLMLDYFKKM